MEKKIDITNKAVAEILSKATEYLQPNPAYRAKLGMLNTVSKIRGQVKTTGYPQTEGLLGDCMLKYGKELGEQSTFDNDTYKRNVPMFVKGDLHHLKKLEGRRLDYDYKKKRVGKIPDEEVRQAVEKFEESKELAERSMFNFLENDVEQVSQLAVFIEAALDYHRQSAEILLELQSKLQIRIAAASDLPKREYHRRHIKRSPSELNGISATSINTATGSNIPDQPCCRGLYDFEPENQGELGFKEGDIITLTNQIDENWYEGMLHGESGFFPINYVEVIVPLPQ
ncbi:PREDICTED: endophilin-A3 [Chrysochloris asiatica]|uniref:Endophilin-A3 n=1 Tax=Chrysochloris asiatica TaxID=185453 RepID=A0A9B0U030_CHRAS|nr:PREDICTED: endophilin-A3 [Chrysochloris asiatica]